MLNTTTEAPPDAAPAAPLKSPRRRVLWWALPVAVAVVALVFVLQPDPPRVQRLEIPEGWPNPKTSFKNSLLRRVPVGWWRMRDALLGPKQGVMIAPTFVMPETWSAADVERMGLGAPVLADTNGLRVWFIPSNRVVQVRGALSQRQGTTTLSTMRVQTADGMPAMIMSGAPGLASAASFNVDTTGWFEPVIRGGRLDLKVILSCAPPPPQAAPAPGPFSINARAVVAVNSTPTNPAPKTLLTIPQLDPLGVRVQLREGEEVLLVQEKRAALGGRPFVVFLKAAPIPKK